MIIKRNAGESYKEVYLKESTNPINKSLFVKIIYMFMKYIVSKALEGHEVKLPQGMGKLYVKGTPQKMRYDEQGKIKGLAPDWVSTKKFWDSNPEAKKQKKLLYHLNHHTDGVIYRYNWSKNRVIVDNKGLYSLKMSRANKRAVSNLIKNGKEYLIR